MTDLICALCMFTREDPNEAETIINGQAVCEDHGGYVQGERFSVALGLLREQEDKTGD